MSTPLRVLIACEFTGTVRDAFRERGFEAWSCDLEGVEPEGKWPNYHLFGDVRWFLDGPFGPWDLLIAHPPCTRLCNSGVRWLSKPPEGRTLESMQRELEKGAALFSELWNAPIKRVAVENPVMHKHAKARIENYQEFTQSIQPWQFGDFERKRTCLWLRGLPPLRGLYASEEECAAALGRTGERPDNRVHSMSPGADRGKERSRFFPSVARAMAEQWGGFALEMERIAV